MLLLKPLKSPVEIIRYFEFPHGIIPIRNNSSSGGGDISSIVFQDGMTVKVVLATSSKAPHAPPPLYSLILLAGAVLSFST